MNSNPPTRIPLTRRQMKRMANGSSGGMYVPQFVVPLSWKRRLLRSVGRATWRLTKRAWARRRPLAPLFAAVALLPYAAIAHAVPYGDRTVVGLAVLFIGAVALRELGARHRRIPLKPMRPSTWAYTGIVGGLAFAWLLWAAREGVGAPRPGWWLGLVAVAVPPAMWRYRIRRKPEQHPMVADWEKYAANPQGFATGSVMHPPTPITHEHKEIGVQAVVEFPRGSLLNVQTLAQHTARIASIYDTDLASIAIDQVPDNHSVRFASVNLFTRNPLLDNSPWPGAEQVFDPVTGVMDFSWFLTGGTANIRYWSEAGPQHLLVAGATGSGKSEGINTFLGVEKFFSPLLSSVVIDPQYGQSAPRFVDNVAFYAKGAAEGEDVLAELHTEMFRRNALLSEVEYEDEWGNQVVGINSFVPTHPVIRTLGLPLICVTIDEAAMLLKSKRSVGLLQDLVTMSRKCGIRFLTAFQTPLLDQVKNNVIREQLLAQVILFRTGSPISANAVNNGVLPASPHLLPRDMPGACYVISDEARPVISRTRQVRNLYEVANAGEITPLPELVSRLELRRELRKREVAVLTAAAEGRELPAAEEANTAGEQVVEEHATNVSLRDRILDYFDRHPGYATTGHLAKWCGDAPSSSITSACNALVARKQIVKPYKGGKRQHGMWGSLDTEWAAADPAGVSKEAAA